MSKFILSAFADEIDADLTTQMDVLEKHNINYIEMRGVNGKCIVDYSLNEVKQIKEQLDKREFKISSIGSPIGKIDITDNFTPHLDLFKHTIEIARILESKYIRMFSFFMPEGENPEIYRDEVMERWNRFIETAKGSNLVLLHENEKGIYGDTPLHCLDLLKTMDCSYMKAVFDPANFVQCKVNTYEDAYNVLKDYIVYMHIKDAVSDTGYVVPAGKGDGKIKEILTDLHNKGYEGFVSLEPHLGNFVGFASLEKEDSPISDLPDGGAEKFAVAANALNDIIKQIK